SLVRAQYRPFTKETCRGPTDLKHAGRANAAFDRPQSSCGPRNLYAERTSLKSLSPPVVPAATVLSSPPNPDGAPSGGIPVVKSGMSTVPVGPRVMLTEPKRSTK